MIYMIVNNFLFGVPFFALIEECVEPPVLLCHCILRPTNVRPLCDTFIDVTSLTSHYICTGHLEEVSTLALQNDCQVRSK